MQKQSPLNATFSAASCLADSSGDISEQILHDYVYDFLRKKHYHETAQKFLLESKIKPSPVPVDSPEGFLSEWWNIFWDIFSAKAGQPASKEAVGYLEMKDALSGFGIGNGRQHQLPQQQNLHNHQNNINHSFVHNLQQQSVSIDHQINHQLAFKQKHDIHNNGSNNTTLPLASAQQQIHHQLQISPLSCNNIAKPQKTPIISPQTITGPLFPPQNMSPSSSEKLQENAGLTTSYPPFVHPIVLRAMESLGLGGRDIFSLSSEERNRLFIEVQNIQQQFYSRQLHHPMNSKKQSPKGINAGTTVTTTTTTSISLNEATSLKPHKQFDMSHGKAESLEDGLALDIILTENKRQKQPATAAASTTNLDQMLMDTEVENNLKSLEGVQEDFTKTIDEMLSGAGKDEDAKEIKVLEKSFSLDNCHSGKISCCSISSDGKLMASGGYDRLLVVWDMENQSVKSSIEAHSSHITCVKFAKGSRKSSDGENVRYLASGSFDKLIKVWNVYESDVVCKWSLSGHSGTICDLDFCPRSNDNEDVLCSGDVEGNILFWKISNGQCIQRIPLSGSIRALKYHPLSGEFVALASGVSLVILNPSTGKVLQSVQVSAVQKNVQSIDWKCEKNIDLVAVATDQEAVVYDFSRHKLSKLMEISAEKINCCIIPKSDILIFGGYQRLEVWKLVPSPKLLDSISGHESIISCLDYFGDDIVSSGHDQHLNLWKLNNYIRRE